MKLADELGILPPVDDSDVTEQINLLIDDVPRLARQMMLQYAQINPRHAEFGAPAYLQRESVHTARIVMQTVLTSVISVDPAIDETLKTIIPRAMHRVEEQLPLREYLRVWTFGLEALTDAVVEALDDSDTVVPVLTRMRRAYDLIFHQAAETYALAAGDLDERSTKRDRDVLYALTEGARPQIDEPELGGTSFGHLWIDAAPDVYSKSAENRLVALNRTARLTRAYLIREVPSVILIDINGQQGRLVLEASTTDLGDIAAGLAEALGVNVILATEPIISRESVPQVAATALAALETARSLGMVNQHVQMSDVALQHQLSHSSPALPSLISRCSPFIDDETLRVTVAGYLKNYLDRRLTADALFVHPNTIDNRLAKIRTLTGLDIHKPRDLMTIAIGLAANNSLPS